MSTGINIGTTLKTRNRPPLGEDGPTSGDAILKEDGDFLLLESGDFILKED